MAWGRIVRSAIRHALGDHHTYEFIEGSVACEAAPGLSSLTHSDDEFFRYIDPAAVIESGRSALADLEALIHDAGPFDGILAFSEGAGLAASLLIHRARLDAASGASQPLIKCAVFFSGGVPKDPETGRLMSFDEDGQVIDIPTAHIWGRNDDLYPTFGPVLSKLCKPEASESFVHEGGHEIPGARDVEAIRSCVAVIRKTLELATIFC
ncbi:hypothetical protein K504DRAFT_483944 [Pleomassaria siparia CBS 279.74]|uniref:Serine hydrolase domain-containing protein n=1 Tax=Pleomassaria siparia CBS 279.74 TaxID=1314801 RepID=A0A6G1K0T0_9PLEO|nr:hypothetical protein K504DRAFT_483944 [Pleomassaria siparia CBS 279.74]